MFDFAFRTGSNQLNARSFEETTTETVLAGACVNSNRFLALCRALLLLSFVFATTAETASAQAQRTNRALSNQGGLQTQPPVPPAQQPLANAAPNSPVASNWNVNQLLSPDGLSGTLKMLLLTTVLSLAPSILIMTTSFVRFVVVLGLLRQALGTQQLPPNQVMISLCMFLTFLVMAPVWQQAYDQGIAPYTNNQPLPGDPEDDRLTRAFKNTARPLRRFMGDQIEATGNSDAVWMFLEFQSPGAGIPDDRSLQSATYEEIPLSVLLPAYMLSELKTAFVIGFQIYLPFLVIDMVVSTVLISMGMMMMPPVMVSLPFKLLLFVMIDGWFLTVGMMLESVRPFG